MRTRKARQTLEQRHLLSYPAAQDGYTYVSSVASVSQEANDVTLTLEAGERIRFRFLEGNVFRMYMAAPGEEFQEYPTPNSSDHSATITNKTDADYYTDYKVEPQLIDDDSTVTMIAEGGITITVDKATAMMTVTNAQGETVIKEAAPIQYRNGSTIQTLATSPDEYFYGGGTQNGRFSHKGEVINITNSNNWVDGGVASPNPFYWSTNGYGVVRNTWKPGAYDFTSDETITTTHNEERFDAYFFVDDSAAGILKDYYELTGNPVELPEYAWYLGHLNCYNRDYWLEVDEGTRGAVKLGDKWYRESQTDNGGERETLNNDDNISARAIIDEYGRLRYAVSAGSCRMMVMAVVMARLILSREISITCKHLRIMRFPRACRPVCGHSLICGRPIRITRKRVNAISTLK